MIYEGSFETEKDVLDAFNISSIDGHILYADYQEGGYEGNAEVVFLRDKKIYYVSSSHCSCYGLEGTWEPEELTEKMIKYLIANGAGFWREKADLLEAICEITSPDISDDRSKEWLTWLKLKN